jgi:hypothetical protein
VVDTFRKFRDPVEGRKLIIEENFFVKGLLPMGCARGLAQDSKEQAYYGKFEHQTSFEKSC